MRLRALLLAIVALHFALPGRASAQEPAPAPAPEASPDTVYAVGEGPLRGTIRELARGSHVVLELAIDHRVVTIPWSRIIRIEHASWAPLPKAPGEAPTSPATVGVHIDAPSTVDLETRARNAPRNGAWTPVCTSPCDRQVPADAEYRISGHGVRSSLPFRLMASGSAPIVLTVDPGSTGGLVLGIVGASLGGLTLICGLLILLVGVAVDSGEVEGIGGVTSLVGGALTVGGVSAIVSNARSDVDQSAAGPSRSASFRVPSPIERSVRAAATVPLFTVSF